MLKENWIKDDLFTHYNMNEILTELYSKLFNINITSPEMVGITYNEYDWIYTNDLNYIENYIMQLCNYFGVKFEKKYWNNINGISYKDINRWCKAINLCDTSRENNKVKIYVSENIYVGEGLNI